MSIYSVNQLISSVALQRLVAIELNEVTFKVSKTVLFIELYYV